MRFWWRRSGGILMPSVDRVGRYFPLVIATRLTGQSPSLTAMAQLSAWYDAAEALALSTLESGFALAEFNAGSAQLHLPASLISGSQDKTVHGRSLWWVGADPATGLQFDGLPPADAFDQHFMQADTQQPPASAIAEFVSSRRQRLTIDVAGAAMKGTRRGTLAEMTVIGQDNQAMSLISGIGQHPGIAAAAKVVADTLATVTGPFSMNDLVADAKGKLGRSNTLLRARGLQTGETFAASVVTLLVQAERYSVLWAGNARAYLLRDGEMRLLTRDHVEPRLPTLLTRAIGGAAQLSLDSAIGQARANDIFLLCSAGLATTLSEQEIAETLANVVSARQAALHLTQDALIAGAALDVSALAIILSSGNATAVN
jgi:type VI secretion system protein ImpM